MPQDPGVHREGPEGRQRAVFIGLENINPANLTAGQVPEPHQRIPPDVPGVAKQSVLTYAGYILGLPGRHARVDPARHRDHQARAAGRHPRVLLPDPAPRFRGPQGAPRAGRLDGSGHEQVRCRTPLHGASADVETDLEQVYMDAWNRYYSPEHVETIMRRGESSGINRTKLFNSLTIFLGAPTIEGVHPLQFGFIRRKIRTQRRHGMPIVNPLIFYPWRVYDFVRAACAGSAVAAEPAHPAARARSDGEILHRRGPHPDHGGPPTISSRFSPTRSRKPTALRRLAWVEGAARGAQGTWRTANSRSF